MPQRHRGRGDFLIAKSGLIFRHENRQLANTVIVRWRAAITRMSLFQRRETPPCSLCLCGKKEKTSATSVPLWQERKTSPCPLCLCGKTLSGSVANARRDGVGQFFRPTTQCAMFINWFSVRPASASTCCARAMPSAARRGTPRGRPGTDTSACLRPRPCPPSSQLSGRTFDVEDVVHDLEDQPDLGREPVDRGHFRRCRRP